MGMGMGMARPKHGSVSTHHHLPPASITMTITPVTTLAYIVIIHVESTYVSYHWPVEEEAN